MIQTRSKITQRLLFMLPEDIRNRYINYTNKIKFEQYMKSRLGHFYVHVDSGPIGKEELIMRTSLMSEEDVPRKTDPNVYLSSGRWQMLSWMNILEKSGFNIRTAGAIMELGCGTARLIRHLRCIDGIRLVGTDAQPELIEWCSKNVPGVEFHKNNLEPPLKFADDNTFDLVFAASVFTHIPAEYQKAWIQEMYRIIRPGGFLLCDVAGRSHQERQLNQEEKDRLQKDGVIILTANDTGASLSTKIVGSWDIFQSRGEVLRAFRSSFTVVDYIPSHLDVLVLQKPL